MVGQLTFFKIWSMKQQKLKIMYKLINVGKQNAVRVT